MRVLCYYLKFKDKETNIKKLSDPPTSRSQTGKWKNVDKGGGLVPTLRELTVKRERQTGGWGRRVAKAVQVGEGAQRKLLTQTQGSGETSQRQ